MPRISEIISNSAKRIWRPEDQCDILVTADTPVKEVLMKMQQSNCDFLGIGGDDQQVAMVLYKDEILQALMEFLDNNEEKVQQLQQQLDGKMVEYLDTMQKSVKSLLDNENHKLALIIENAAEGLMMINQQGQVEIANTMIKKLLGLKKDSELSEVQSAIKKIGVIELLNARQNVENRGGGKFVAKTDDGIILGIDWKEIINAEGKYLGNVVTLKDITRQVEHDKAKTEFIASISHELRTPLTTIQSTVSNLLAGVVAKPSKKTEKHLKTMHAECQRLANMINDLLDMSKLETDSMPLNRAGINLVDIASQAIKALQDQASEKSLELTCQVQGRVSGVNGDQKRIYQVLWNLISNAIKFSKNRGRVDVRLIDQGDEVVAAVADNGIGISSEKQKHIFNKFYQISRQAGAGYMGSGLGLTICKGIASLHGGKMWLESKEGHGSTFYFSIPKTDPYIVLYKHLGELAKATDAQKNKFAMMVANFNSNCDKKELLFHSVKSMVADIMQACSNILNVDKNLMIQTDIFEMVFVLTGKSQPDIKQVVEKISEIIRQKTNNYAPDVMIKTNLGVAFYPMDTTDIRQLGKIAQYNVNTPG